MIAFLSQNDALIDSKTVYENIALSYQSGNRIPDRREIQNTLALLNIEDIDSFLNRKASSLSASEKEKVRIAESLVRNTNILLIDGLSSSLDTESEKKILGILKNISEEHLVILSGHQLEIIKPYASGIIELSDKTCKETHFEETETYDPEKYRIKKGHHLSFSASFRFALSFLNSKKLSLLFSFLITFITILSSGLSLISLVNNPVKIQTQELYRENIKDVILHQDSFLRLGLYPDSKLLGGFTDRQKEAIKSHTKQKELIDVYEDTFFRAKNSKTLNPEFRSLSIIPETLLSNLPSMKLPMKITTKVIQTDSWKCPKQIWITPVLSWILGCRTKKPAITLKAMMKSPSHPSKRIFISNTDIRTMTETSFPSIAWMT